MKRLFLLASALTILASTAVNAAPRGIQVDQEVFKTRPGATIRIGDNCWASVDSSRGFGYWDDCDSSVSYARARSRRGLQESEAGGDGGGGGGGGGNR